MRWLLLLLALLAPVSAWAADGPYVPNVSGAGFPHQGRVFGQDFQPLVVAARGNGVISGCEVTPQGTPDMTVHVADCTVQREGVLLTVAAGNLTAVADGTSPRFYFVSVSATPTLAMTAGTPATGPVPPAIPQSGGINNIVLAQVYVPAGATALTASNIVDKRVTVASRGVTVDPRAYGAKCDAQALGDPIAGTLSGCSISSSSATLTCPTGTFATNVIGKIIAVYDAGPTTAGFIQPLFTTVSARSSSAIVTLADSASNATADSPRVVWGTDDTAACQSALDAVADAGAGTLQFPGQHCLVTNLALPCAKLGTFEAGTCSRTYNNITIAGTGRNTELENIDITGGVVSGFAERAVIQLGGFSAPHETGNDRLANITIRDLAIRQVANATNSSKLISSYATTDILITRTSGLGGSYEGYVMGGVDASQRWTVTNNVLDGVGQIGGPAHALPLSALNISGMWPTVTLNTIRGSGLCFEIGSKHGYFANNLCDGSWSSAAILGMEFGSSVTGFWDNEINGNILLNAYAGVGNTLGTADRTRFLNNFFLDGNLALASGQETNSVLGDEIDTVVHGDSVIKGNIFAITKAPATYPILIGNAGGPQYGLERVVIEDNLIQWWSAFGFGAGADHGVPCQINADVPDAAEGCIINQAFLAMANVGGGPKWKPSTSYALGDHATPVIANDRYYIVTTAGTSGTTEPSWCLAMDCTVADNGTVWTNAGKRPTVTARRNTVDAPPGAADTAGNAVAYQAGTDWEAIHLSDLRMSFPWAVHCDSCPGTIYAQKLAIVPPAVPFGEQELWLSGKPVVGLFSLGDHLNFATRAYGAAPSTFAAGHERVSAVRAGHAGAVWATAQTYAYATFVVPTVDNAHVYYQSVLAGCTSHATTEPTWADGVTDNDCIWKDGGAAVLWSDAQALVVPGGVPSVSTCGTGSPSVAGTDSAGVITTGTSVTACTLTFSRTQSAAPVCVANTNLASVAVGTTSVSTTAWVLDVTSTPAATVYYHCLIPGA